MNRDEAHQFIEDLAEGMRARARAEYADTLTPIGQSTDAEDLYGEKYVLFRDLCSDIIHTRLNNSIDKTVTTDTSDDRNP